MDYRFVPDHDTRIESKFNMYERQIDQLFDLMYRDQDNIKLLFSRIDSLQRTIQHIETRLDDSDINSINSLKICIQNYYQLELENKKRMEWCECYQFQLFIVQLFIMCYLAFVYYTNYDL